MILHFVLKPCIFIQALFYYSQIYLCPHFIFGLKICLTSLLLDSINVVPVAMVMHLSLNLQRYRKKFQKTKVAIEIFVKYFIKP